MARDEGELFDEQQGDGLIAEGTGSARREERSGSFGETLMGFAEEGQRPVEAERRTRFDDYPVLESPGHLGAEVRRHLRDATDRERMTEAPQALRADLQNPAHVAGEVCRLLEPWEEDPETQDRILRAAAELLGVGE